METGTVQDRRVDAMREPTQLLERRLRQRGGACEHSCRPSVSGGQRGPLPATKLERQRQQSLLRTVVQVALQPSTLGVTAVDER